MSTFFRIHTVGIVLVILLTLYAERPLAVTLCPPEVVFDNRGRSVAGAGDVNNDGYPDIIVSAMGYSVCVSSGLNGDTIWTFSPEQLYHNFGSSLAGIGDINNDGYDDVIIGASENNPAQIGAGRAYVFSGLDGDTLFLFTGENIGDQFGASVSSAGDVNNDGYDDMIIGAPWAVAGGPLAGRAYVFSGLDGDTLFVFTAESSYDHLGVSVAGAGDVNGDGYADIIVGADGSDVSDGNAGRVYVFSGLDGDTLHLFYGEGSHDAFGRSVSGAGDVNNDGYDDVIIGSWSNDGNGFNSGRAYVFSGLDGDTLHVFSGEVSSDKLGWSVSGAGDVNNDGYDDLVVGASFGGGSHTGRVYVFSGFDGSSLHMFTGETIHGYFGAMVSGVGDVNQDGYNDIVVSSHDQAYLFTLGDACTSCCLNSRGNTNGDFSDLIDVADLTYFVDYLFNRGASLPCPNEGDVDGSGEANIADLTYLVAYLYSTGPVPPSCP